MSEAIAVVAASSSAEGIGNSRLKWAVRREPSFVVFRILKRDVDAALGISLTCLVVIVDIEELSVNAAAMKKSGTDMTIRQTSGT